MTSIIIRILIFCFLLMLPFSATGVMLGGYILSPSVIVAMLICIALSFYMRSLPVNFLYFLLMISVFVLGVIARHPFKTYVFSLLALMTVAIPVILIRLNIQSTTAAINGHAVGLAITLTVVWLEIICRLLGISLVISFFEQLFPYRREALPFLGYQRPSGGFQEPAHLAIYLVISVAFIDSLAKWCRKSYHSYLKLLAIISVFAIGSVSGMVLLLSYYLIIYCGFFGRFICRAKISRGTLYLCFFALMVLAILFLAFSEVIVEVIVSFANRIGRAIDFLLSLQLHKSEGSRVNAIPVMFMAWFSEGPMFFLFGTGYANSEEYLISKYGGIAFSSFAQGNIANIYAVIGVSTGFLGLLTYLIFLRSLYAYKVVKASLALKVVFLFLHFFTGDFISLYFWGFIFMMIVASASKSIAPSSRGSYSFHRMLLANAAVPRSSKL